MTGLTAPFSLEIFFGDRVALLGANGTGKTQLLRLFAGEPVPHSGEWRLGARVIAGWFRQTHDRPELHPMRLVDILWKHGLDRAGAMRALTRYELDEQAAQEFSMLSGGQQARFQILLLELGGATLLLLDEPTDNLDLHSAEALERALDSYQGTVVTVTHDRWFTRTFDRFILIDTDGGVREVPEPVWDEPKRDSLEHV